LALSREDCQRNPIFFLKAGLQLESLWILSGWLPAVVEVRKTRPVLGADLEPDSPFDCSGAVAHSFPTLQRQNIAEALAMTKMERLLSPGSTELPDCRCGREMVHASSERCGADAEKRVYRCSSCGHEMRLTVWLEPALADGGVIRSDVALAAAASVLP
jgi:hypothetical protein